jgi:hypothetical protein
MTSSRSREQLLQLDDAGIERKIIGTLALHSLAKLLTTFPAGALPESLRAGRTVYWRGPNHTAIVADAWRVPLRNDLGVEAFAGATVRREALVRLYTMVWQMFRTGAQVRG